MFERLERAIERLAENEKRDAAEFSMLLAAMIAELGRLTAAENFLTPKAAVL